MNIGMDDFEVVDIQPETNDSKCVELARVGIVETYRDKLGTTIDSNDLAYEIHDGRETEITNRVIKRATRKMVGLMNGDFVEVVGRLNFIILAHHCAASEFVNNCHNVDALGLIIVRAWINQYEEESDRADLAQYAEAHIPIIGSIIDGKKVIPSMKCCVMM
jgi:hypothetical protein